MNDVNEILEEIRQAIINIDYEETKELVKKALNKNIPAYEILTKSLSKGMEIIGKKYEEKEYFLAELLGAGELMKEILEILKPYLKGEKIETVGKIVLGTVRGDIHDIGKNVFKMLASSSGFQVFDLGVDVPAEKFIEKIEETDAEILGLSAMLTTTMIEMKNVVEKLNKTGIRKKVKIIIGGAPITEDFAKEIGADAAAKDAAHGLTICKEWIKGEKNE
jgi:corrinoid protein of di/trimethylamine methyltransferase